MSRPFFMPDAIQRIDINAQVPKDESPSTVKNAPADEKDLKLLKKLLDKGKKHRKPYDKNWDKYEAYYNGDQWYGKERPKYRASPCANIIRPTIQTIVPIMTDTQPGIDLTPQEPTDYAFADMLSKVIRSWWKRSGMAITLVEVLTDSMKFDVGVLKAVWNPDLEHGRGDMEVVALDPRNVYVPDGANNFEKNCPWTIELYPSTVGELKRKYPKKAEFIKATGKRKDKSAETSDTSIRLVSPVDKDEGADQPDISGADESGIVWCAEMWIDDYAIVEVEVESEGGTEKVKKRKYPNGKIVQAIPELNVHLATSANPYKDGCKPYIRFVNTLRPREFYAEGEVGPQIESQDLINLALSKIYDYLTSMVNPTWIVDFESGVDPDMITNQIGLVIPKKKAGEVKRDAPPPMPPQAFEFYKMIRELADTQSGVHDVTQGRRPEGVTAASAISTMQEAAQTRIRLKERNMQVSVERLGFFLVSRVLQFYTKPRIVKLTGNTQLPSFFEFYVDENEENGDYRWHKREWVPTDEETQQYVPKQWEEGDSKGLFDVEVAAGTALPFLKAQRGQLAMRLLELQVIDPEAVLETLEWPNREQVMHRMQEKAAQAAQMQPPGGP